MDLSATLGCVEMERAAARVVELCVEHGSWSRPVVYEDMRARDEFDKSEKNGFLMLVYHGWLRMGYLKGLFFAKRELIDRIKDRLPDEAKGLLYDETSGWLFDTPNDPYRLHPGGK